MTRKHTQCDEQEEYEVSLSEMLRIIDKRPITSWSCEGVNTTSTYDYRKEDCACTLSSEIDGKRIFFSHIYTPYCGKNASPQKTKDEYTILYDERIEIKTFWVPLDSHGIRKRLVLLPATTKDLFTIRADKNSQDYHALKSTFDHQLGEGRKIYGGWGRPSTLFLPC